MMRWLISNKIPDARTTHYAVSLGELWRVGLAGFALGVMVCWIALKIL
ncbi:hypothetical protein [Ralstonia pseudosolanacearum]